MEKTQKRKSSGGFMRSLFKGSVKPESIARFGGSNKVKPSPSEENASFGVQMEQKATTTTFVKPNYNYGLHDNYCCYYDASYGHKDNNVISNNHYYGGDENVDLKAASYISNVRERFKLEKVDSGQRKMYLEEL